MRDFIIEHLNENPQELIGDEYWEFLMTEVQIYIEHKKTCQKSLETLTFFNNTVADIIINKADALNAVQKIFLQYRYIVQHLQQIIYVNLVKMN